MRFSKLRVDLRIALFYFVFAGLWILLSDRLLAMLVTDISLLSRIQTYKGWAFVAVSALVIYLLLRRELRLRQTTEGKISESEERYQLISSVTSDYMFSTRRGENGQFRLTWVAGAFEEITGYTFEEYIAHGSWRATVHPDDLAKDDRDMDTLRANQRVNSEIRTIRKNGEICWVQSYAHPVVDPKTGELIEIYGAVRDITTRKQTEDLIRSERNFSNTLLDSLPGVFYMYGEDRKFLRWNKNFETVTRYSGEEIARMNPLDFFRTEEKDLVDQRIHEAFNNGNSWVEADFLTKDGRRLPYFFTGRIINVDGKPCLIGTGIDITERKRAEEALRESEERFFSAFEHAAIGMALVALNGHWLRVNRAVCDLFGFSSTELLSKTFNDITHPDDLEADLAFIRQVLSGERQTYQMEKRYFHKQGHTVWTLLSVSLVRDSRGKPLYFISQIQDITERKLAEEQVKRRVVELEALYQSGIAFSQTLDPVDIGEKIIEVLGGRLDWHHAAVRVRRGESQEVELLAFSEADSDIDKSQLKSVITHVGQGLAGWVIEHGETVRSNDLVNDPRYVATYAGMKSGLYIPIKMRGRTIGCISAESEMENAFTAEDERLLATLAMQATVALENAALFQSLQKELTEHKQTEKALTESEARYRSLIDQLPAIVYLDNVQVCPPSTQFISPRIREMLGYEPAEWLAGGFDIWKKAIHPEDLERALEFYYKSIETGTIVSQDYRMVTRDGRTIWVQDSTATQRDKDGRPISLQGIISDITENKKLEAAMRLQSAALEETANAIVITDVHGVIEWVNPAYTRLTGYSAEEAVGKKPSILYSGVQEVPFYKNLWDTILNGKVWRGELVNKRKDGTLYNEEQTVTPLFDSNNNITHFIGVKQDITSRKQSEVKIHLQLQRLRALNEIDNAINASGDMNLTLGVFLREVLIQLDVDAADILLLKPTTRTLEYALGKGFNSKNWGKSSMSMEAGLAGRAIIERKSIHEPDISAVADEFVRAALYIDEGFISYFGIPLIIRGQIKGVLEIFHRSRLDPDPEWLDYLNVLAGQAAIAIENSQLFEDIQQSNQELIIAYDATIEGWSLAMDLRDKETEGHTRRVTDLTLKLARRLGISEQEQVQIRRGALLHDIGKLGVPDHILLKPDKLTDEEWNIMRQHPTYAYEMLLPIKYLRPALDIPYCHHEKWDGSGYPRGLKGNEIPLAARIFAVIDVWDALRSDRPYREGWSSERTKGFIQEQSGKHFDPEVVEAFLKLLDDEKGEKI